MFAKDNDFTIVTKGVDFIEINLIKGFPPKIVWIRNGSPNSNVFVKQKEQ